MIELESVGGYALTYFTLSLIVAGIAQGKNHSGLSWWLISVLLTPPIALFLLVVFGNKVPFQGDD